MFDDGRDPLSEMVVSGLPDEARDNTVPCA
jgi:hypothetical protein